MRSVDLLAPIALERARLVGPVVLLGVTVSLIASEPSGIPLSGPVIAWNLFAITLFALLCTALVRRKVPEHRAHLAGTLIWWAAVAGTLISQLSSDSRELGYLYMVEVVGASFLLSTRHLLVSFAVFDLLWVPLQLHTPSPVTPAFMLAMLVAQAFAIVFHRVQRNAVLRAESNARALAQQLEEHERLHAQLLHAQRMEAIGTLSAGLAHDMNNILGSITNMAELLRDQASELSRSDLDGIIKQSARGAELTRGLLAFSRKGQYRRVVVDVDRMLRDVVPLLSRTLPKSVDIRAELASAGACAVGDPSHLQQVIINLGVNAADAMKGTGTLSMSTARTILDGATARALAVVPGDYVRILVTDTGCGMDEATRKRAFEPFFTTKPLGKGTGLGLSSVWGIVHGHGGAIDVDSKVGSGTTFSIYLPVSPEPARDDTIPPPTRVVRHTTVLVVDDETAVRTSTMRLLQRRGFDTVGASDGVEALRVLAEREKDIGLVILDMGMPHMGGRECFEKLRELSSVPVLIATGFAIDEDMRALMARGAAVIEKPYPSKLLEREVTRLLEAS